MSECVCGREKSTPDFAWWMNHSFFKLNSHFIFHLFVFFFIGLHSGEFVCSIQNCSSSQTPVKIPACCGSQDSPQKSMDDADILFVRVCVFSPIGPPLTNTLMPDRHQSQTYRRQAAAAAKNSHDVTTKWWFEGKEGVMRSVTVNVPAVTPKRGVTHALVQPLPPALQPPIPPSAL